MAERSAAHAKEGRAQESGYEGDEVQHIAQVDDAPRYARKVRHRAKRLEQSGELSGESNADCIQTQQHEDKSDEQAQYEGDYLVSSQA